MIWSMEFQEFTHKLNRYSHEIAKANSEATKAFLFLEFMRSIFGDVEAKRSHEIYPDLEKSIKSEKTVIIKGRIDAFLGNLIIEFENDLKGRKIEEAKAQLRKYTSILWNNKDIVNYLCIATDGLKFLIYRPRSAQTNEFTDDNIELESVDKFDIREDESITIYKRLDRYILYKTLVPPTATDIVYDFGSESIILKDCLSMLSKSWESIKNQCVTIYQEWAKYLSIVYGSEVENEELFLKHSYLATLAKLMAYSFYQANALPTSEEVVNQILKGEVFKEWGIENFLIEDFFSWVVYDKVNKDGIKAAYRILDGLARYDLTRLNEDVLKELYQQLVDPTERHYLGEFYTPDWLAEMMVKEVVNDPYQKVLDPACGSGTFLASTIRYKLSCMSDQIPFEQVKTIIQTVYGIDVHPLAVLISKANYLMALGNQLTKKKGSFSIPVYMADSITFPEPVLSISSYGSKKPEGMYVYNVDEKTAFILPKSLVDSDTADNIIDSIKDFADKKLKDSAISTTGFETYLAKRHGVTNDQFKVVLNTVNTLIDLIKRNKDTIHPFILKNIYKPSIIGKFDVIVGNPPWLSYRYIKSNKRQSALKKIIIGKYHLLDKSEEKLMTQMELATMFFARCTDIYLKENGKIAFVLPRGIFASDQHKNFRENIFNPKIGYWLIFDLERNQHERVSPLFSVESCVVFGEKGKQTEYPINTRLMTGRLKLKNSTLADIQELKENGQFTVTDHKTLLIKIGGRTSWDYEENNLPTKKRQCFDNWAKADDATGLISIQCIFTTFYRFYYLPIIYDGT